MRQVDGMDPLGRSVSYKSAIRIHGDVESTDDNEYYETGYCCYSCLCDPYNSAHCKGCPTDEESYKLRQDNKPQVTNSFGDVIPFSNKLPAVIQQSC